MAYLFGESDYLTHGSIEKALSAFVPLWCRLCKRDGESIDFCFTVVFLRQFWVKILDQFGAVGVFPKRWSPVHYH